MSTQTENQDLLINPVIHSIIPQRRKPRDRCLTSSFCVLSYLLFGYFCADMAILFCVNYNCSTPSIRNNTINLYSIEGKKFLWASEGVVLIILTWCGIYKICKIYKK